MHSYFLNHIRLNGRINVFSKGISGFFEKLKLEGHTGQTFEFLSTHPSDDNRLANIHEVWIGLGAPGGEYFETEYLDFKTTMLP